MTAPGARWLLLLGLAAFVVWAPPALVALPFAALVLAAGPTHTRERLAVGAGAAVAVALLLLPPSGRVQAFTNAYTVLVTAAFTLLALYWPGGFVARALRATAMGAIATAGLAWAIWGGGFWAGLRREAGGLALVVLALQTVAGLALAWLLHHRVSARPLEAPLGGGERRDDPVVPAAPGGPLSPGRHDPWLEVRRRAAARPNVQ